MASSADSFFGDPRLSRSQYVWRWAGPPGGQDTAWATDARTEIRWIWREICAGYGLTRRVLPDDGPRAFPHIREIDLGPPTRFTVRLRPGELARDIADIAPRLAVAYEVDDVRVRDLRPGWAVVELVEQPPKLTVVGGGPPREPGPDARLAGRDDGSGNSPPQPLGEAG